MADFSVDKGISWEEILKKSRVVILGEPGSGKTEELRAITERLREAGSCAFFCRIDYLQESDVRQALDIGTSPEFDEWIIGDKEAYFFLDSVDEALLSSRKAFEKALLRFVDALGGSLNRSRVVVSCRVSEWRATADLELLNRYLPELTVSMRKESKETPVGKARKAAEDAQMETVEERDHRVLQLAPLNEGQIRLFAVEKGIVRVDDFINGIERADAMIFAERPQDLLELIQYWTKEGCLGRHADMLDFDINIKLKEHDSDRDLQRPFSADEALTGAQRLAAAVTLEKKDTIILPDKPIDYNLKKASIDPKESLPEWTGIKIQMLLDRAIFDEAIYGTVRFHHRSVREYLTAYWLRHLLDSGKSRRAVENLLFANRYGHDVVIPSMRPIAAWLAIWDERVRNRLRTLAPEVLIEYGDPSVLPVEFRKELLIAFAKLHANHQYTGTSFDITMVRRLSDHQLAPTINNLLAQYAEHTDVSTLLLKLIWQGRISDSVQQALPFAEKIDLSVYVRICAMRAVAAVGTAQQHQHVVTTLMADVKREDPEVLGEMCGLFFPITLSVQQLIKILESVQQPEQYSSSPIQRGMEEIAKMHLGEETAKLLLIGLHSLLKREPYIERRNLEISERHAWLLGSSLKIADLFIKQRDPFSFDPIVMDLFLAFLIGEHYHDFSTTEREAILESAKSWHEFRLHLFWHAVGSARKWEKEDGKAIISWQQAWWYIRDLWHPTPYDLEDLFEAVSLKPLTDDRTVALTAIFDIYSDTKRPRHLLTRLKRVVAGTPKLEKKLRELLHPEPLTERSKKLRRQLRDSKRNQEERRKHENDNRLEWRKILRGQATEIKEVGNPQTGVIWSRTAYLYDRMRENKAQRSHSRLGYSDWRGLIDEFGYDVAKNFRDGCVEFWRGYDPFNRPNRRSDNSIPWPRIIGLSGIAMEAVDDAHWAKGLSQKEALIAAHYSVCELNGFPSWLGELVEEFPSIVDEVIINELNFELQNCSPEKPFTHTLSALQYGNKELRKRYTSLLVEILSTQEPVNDQVFNSALSLILSQNQDPAIQHRIAMLASDRFLSTRDRNRKITWLSILLYINGLEAVELLKAWISDLGIFEKQRELMVSICATLTDYGEPRFGNIPRDYEKIEVLNELLPLIYGYVRFEDDAHHAVVYTPGARDHAERTRSHLLSIVANAPGRKSYDVLMKLANSWPNGYFKDRMFYLAREHAAQDAEQAPWPGAAVAEFSLSAMKRPGSEAELFDIALSRLDDLKINIEDGDESMAMLLLALSEETEVRVYFASQLRQLSRSFYTVGSEEELADATRTDIRVNAPQVSSPVPIELKIADRWSLAQLRERIENQLIGQYMRVSQCGVFLVVHDGRKTGRWRDSQNRKLLSFSELTEMLKRHAIDLAGKYSRISRLEVVGIDFTARARRKLVTSKVL